MIIISHTPKNFKREEADKIASELQKRDPEWKYTPVHPDAPGGLSHVAVYDDTGFYLGLL